MPPTTPPEQSVQPQSFRAVLDGCIIAFLVLTNTVVLAKFAIQLRRSCALLGEDIFLILATLSANFTLAGILVGMHFGLGLPLARVIEDDHDKPQNLIQIVKTTFVSGVISAVCLATAKISLLLLYRRLFIVNQRWLNISWWVNLVYVFCWLAGTVPYLVLECVPVEYYWLRVYEDLKISPPRPIAGHCQPGATTNIGVTLVLSLASDLALLILPIATLLRLQMSARKKIGTVVIFAFGISVVAIELVRIIELFAGAQAAVDPTYFYTLKFKIYTGAQVTTAVLCASWPTVVPQLWGMLHRRKSFGARLASPCNDLFQFGRGRARTRATAHASLGQPVVDNLPLDEILVQTEIEVFLESDTSDE